MTAFVPGFQHDLFISYAHEDDRRWVQAFEDELRDEVSRRLGLGISVWQDTERIRAGENWQVGDSGGHRGSRRVRRASSARATRTRSGAPRERNEFQEAVQGGRVRDQRPLLQGRQDAMARECPSSVSAGDPGRRVLQGRRGRLASSSRPARATSSVPFASWPTVSRRSSGACAAANQRVHVAWPVDECLTAWEQLSDELRSKGFDVQPMGPRDASFADKLLMQDMDNAVMSVHLLGSVIRPVHRAHGAARGRSRAPDDVLDGQRRRHDGR